MRVGVEQPGQHGAARAVDAFVAVEPGADLDDPAVLDHDVGLGERRHRAVEHPPAAEQCPGHRLPSLFGPTRTLPPTAAHAPPTHRRTRSASMLPRTRRPGVTVELQLRPDDAALQARARRFADEVLQPLELECEEHDGLTPASAAAAKQAVLDHGFAAINHTVEDGGQGLDTFQVMLVEEQWGRVTNALWDIPWRPSIPLAAGTEEQKERFLRPACRGERRDAYAITEEGAGLRRDDGRDDRSARRRRLGARGREVARDERRRRRLLPGARPRRRRPRQGDRLPGRQGHARRAARPDPEVHAHVRVRAPDLRVRGRAGRRRPGARRGRRRGSTSRRTGSSRSA